MVIERSLLPRQSLWKHIVAWDGLYGGREEPITLATGAVLVSNSEMIKEILRDRENYVDESAFLRTQNFFPLPPDERKGVVRDFIRLMSPAVEQVPSQLETFMGGRKKFRTQSDGIWFMYSLYKDRIWHPSRSPQYGILIERYISRKTIHDDIQGGLRRLQGAKRASLDQALGNLIVSDGAEFNDLVSIVNAVKLGLTPPEKSELLLRLVQSLVAFTGAGLEFAMFYLSSNPKWVSWIDSEERSRAFVLELQRLFPTAWRLTRTAAKEHRLGSLVIKVGDEIILGHTVSHKDLSIWGEDAENFDPNRWTNQTPSSIFTFGSGHGTCPGKHIAVSVMASSVYWVANNLQIAQGRKRKGIPYVRSILASPRHSLTLTVPEGKNRND